MTVTFLTDQATYDRADQHREKGMSIQETDSLLFDRLLRYALNKIDLDKEVEKKLSEFK